MSRLWWGSVLENVDEILKRANKCLAMAAKASNRKARAEFEMAARQWLLLAAERETFLNSWDISRKH